MSWRRRENTRSCGLRVVSGFSASLSADVFQKWAALLAGCTGSANEEKVVRSAALRSAAERAASLMAARRVATAPCTPSNIAERACRSAPCDLSILTN